MTRSGDEPIPGYRVEEMLGRGQYGEVWKAASPGGTFVALKFLDMTGCHGWKEFRSVQRVKQIRHAHLMPIVAIWLLDQEGQVMADDVIQGLSSATSSTADTAKFEEPDPAHLPARMVIASLLGDSSLRDRLDECLDEGMNGIPRDELLGYMQEAAKGIDYLNSVQHDLGGDRVGVQHCDIKPDNILLTGGSVVIADFGVAQVFSGAEGDARATSLSGSPAYMAPEAFDATPSEASDQYSLAMTYYELRTSQFPLNVESFAAAYDAHRSGKLDFSLVSEEEEEVLRIASNLNPSDRYQSATDFVKALTRATEEEVPAGYEWNKATLAALGVVALLLIGSLSALWFRGPDTREVAFQFDLPGATIVVNGETHHADENGELLVEALAGVPLTVAAKGNADRRDEQWTIDAQDLEANEQFEFAIPYTAAHHTARANEFLSSGQLDKATEAYLIAIRTDRTTYAKLPDPFTLSSADILWDDCMQISPGGDVLIIGDREGDLSKWMISDQGLRKEPSKTKHPARAGIVCVAITNEASAFASDEGEVWIVRDGQLSKLFAEEGADVKVAFTGDKRWLVAAVSSELTTMIYAWDIAADDVASTQRELGEQPGEFPRICSSRDDTVAVATQDATALVRSWSVSLSEHLELGGQQNDVLSLVGAASGNAVAYAGVPGEGGGDQGAALFDVALHRRYSIPSQTRSIPACALNRSGDRLATAERMGANDTSGLVLIWRPDQGAVRLATERVFRYDPKYGDVMALALSDAGGWLAAGHESGAVTLWLTNVSAEEPVVSVGEGGRVVAVRITPNGRWLVSAATDGRIMAIDLLELQMVLNACKKAGVVPRSGDDRITLHDQPVRPATRFLLGSVGT